MFSRLLIFFVPRSTLKTQPDMTPLEFEYVIVPDEVISSVLGKLSITEY